MSTFVQLQNECLAYGFGSSYRERFKSWLNEAQDIVARRTQLRELRDISYIAVSGGTATYALPDDFARVVSVMDATYPTKLTAMSYEDYSTQILDPSRGQPMHYWLDSDNRITFSPNPDASRTIHLHYFKDPTDMSADSDEPLLATAYQGALVAYAVSRAYRSEDDPQQATAFWADWERGLQQMASDRQHEIADGPKQVPGTWSTF